MFASAIGGKDGMNGREKNDNQFKIESCVTLHFSAPKHILGWFVLKFWIFNMLILLYKLLYSSFSFRQQMRWTNEQDVMFLREVLVHEPWNHKYGSQERGKAWEKIAESLNGLNTIYEIWRQSIRDRYMLLVDNFKKCEWEEAAASGISPEETESGIAPADIIGRFSRKQMKFIRSK